MLAVWKKEVLLYFLTPIAYVFMGAFLAVTGLYFTMVNILSTSAEFNSTLSEITFLFMLVVPILTMRLFSEEKRTKTDQLLLTSPVSVTSIVMGKFLAAMTVFFATLVVSLIYPITLAILGNPSWGEIFAGYIGFFLLGGALIAVGCFMSSLTENQLTSAIATFGVLLVFWLSDSLSTAFDSQFIITIINWISVYARYTDFTYGVLSLSQIFYYISFAAVFLFLTVRTIEKRRWSEV